MGGKTTTTNTQNNIQIFDEREDAKKNPPKKYGNMKKAKYPLFVSGSSTTSFVELLVGKAKKRKLDFPIYVKKKDLREETTEPFGNCSSTIESIK